MTKSNKKTTFTQKEVVESINNAVVRALKPAALGEIPEERLRKLRAYSQGLLAPVLKHVDEEFLRPEEAVIILLMASLFIQLKNIMRTDKLPTAGLALNQFEGKEAVAIPREYFSTPDPAEDEVAPPKKRKRK